jgi:uracil permease
MNTAAWVSFICAMVTLIVVIVCSVYGKKMAKLIPFIIGILSGYLTALIFTIIGIAAGID